MRSFFIMLVLTLPVLTGATPVTSPTAPLPKRLVTVASRILDEAQISYVYGGYQVGDDDVCRECNDCLAAKSPQPKDRLRACGICKKCSLDCSHFTNLVFKDAGAPYPYLDTATMLGLSAPDLQRRYGLIDVGTDAALAAAGDLLVYDGHVVLLERRHKPVAGNPRPRGDVVHATGGKDVRGPGEGIQRERFIDLQAFRGPLRRILRHRALLTTAENTVLPVVKNAPPPASMPTVPRLRPVAKRHGNAD